MSNLRLLDPAFGDFENTMRRFFAPMPFEAGEAAPMRMRIDVSEEGNSYLVKADIPGVKKDDISVHIDGNVVQIDAETKRETESRGDGGKVLRNERYFGTVSRTFSLASDIDEGKVQAKYIDGVLSLTLPKKASAQARKINVE